MLLMSGCSPRAESQGVPGPVSTNVTLTAAQRQKIHIQTVKPTSFRRTIDVTGTVGFDNDLSTTVLAPISGPVSQLLVPLGAKVKSGEALALIDSPDFASAASGYRKAEATAKNARRVADLEEDLFQHGAAARRDVDQAETDAIGAEADRDAALRQLHSLGVDDQAIQDMEHHLRSTNMMGTIRAPLAGMLVERLISPGQLLQASGTPCFTVADISQMWVMANVYDSDLASVEIGDAADIITSASTNIIAGEVDNISAILDPNTRSAGVRVVAKNPGGVLKKQMYVRVLIHSRRESTGLLVPVSAILRNDENLPFVYISKADGSFERRGITLGSRVEDKQEVTAGLNDGDQIVVEGGLFVQFLQNQ